MTPAALALAAALLAAPTALAAPPAATAEGAPAAAPPAPAAELEPGPAAAPERLGVSTVAAGGWIARVDGLDVRGGALKLSTGAEQVRGIFPGALAETTAELGVGQTRAGITVWQLALGGRLWTTPRFPVRGGLGLDLGFLTYQRATNGNWAAVGGALGVQAALHADLLSSSRAVGFVELVGSLRTFSGGTERAALLLVGVAFKSAAPVAPY